MKKLSTQTLTCLRRRSLILSLTNLLQISICSIQIPHLLLDIYYLNPKKADPLAPSQNLIRTLLQIWREIYFASSHSDLNHVYLPDLHSNRICVSSKLLFLSVSTDFCKIEIFRLDSGLFSILRSLLSWIRRRGWLREWTRFVRFSLMSLNQKQTRGDKRRKSFLVPWWGLGVALLVLRRSPSSFIRDIWYISLGDTTRKSRLYLSEPSTLESEPYPENIYMLEQSYMLVFRVIFLLDYDSGNTMYNLKPWFISVLMLMTPESKPRPEKIYMMDQTYMLVLRLVFMFEYDFGNTMYTLKPRSSIVLMFVTLESEPYPENIYMLDQIYLLVFRMVFMLRYDYDNTMLILKPRIITVLMYVTPEPEPYPENICMLDQIHMLMCRLVEHDSGNSMYTLKPHFITLLMYVTLSLALSVVPPSLNARHNAFNSFTCSEPRTSSDIYYENQNPSLRTTMEPHSNYFDNFMTEDDPLKKHLFTCHVSLFQIQWQRSIFSSYHGPMDLGSLD